MKKNILAAVLVALLFTNCTPFKIAVSDQLTNTPELAVKGRNGLKINQKLSFGEFKTDKVNRSWTEGRNINGGAMKTLWTTYSQKNQSVHFTLTDSANQSSEVFCIAKTRAEDWTVGENPNSVVNILGDLLGVGGNSDNTYGVQIYLQNEPNPWEMMIDMQQSQGNSKRYTGYLAKSKDDYYTIHPVTAVEKNGKRSSLPFGSMGFEIKNKAGNALAAISMVDNGKVYLASTNSKERFLLANACAALLLHETID